MGVGMRFCGLVLAMLCLVYGSCGESCHAVLVLPPPPAGCPTLVLPPTLHFVLPVLYRVGKYMFEKLLSGMFLGEVRGAWGLCDAGLHFCLALFLGWV